MYIKYKTKTTHGTLYTLGDNKKITENAAAQLIWQGKIINAETYIFNGNYIIRGKKGHPIPYYNNKNAKFPNFVRKESNKKLDFERSIYVDLIKWKEHTRHALFLKGPRQVGKTFILKKFGAEQFKQAIYVDLTNASEDSNKFMDAYLTHAKRFGDSDSEQKLLWNTVFKCFDSKFVDSPNTLIIIDEIQENTRVFNEIRSIKRNLSCRLAVTGSYLALAESSMSYIVPAGDILIIELSTLSFVEFIKAMGLYSKYMSIQEFDLNKINTNEIHTYKLVEKLYNDYVQIGGYPSVVSTYKEYKGNIEQCIGQIGVLLSNFYMESGRYFKNIITDSMWNNTLINTLQDLISRVDLKTETNNELIKDADNIKINKRDKNAMLMWLLKCNIVGQCNIYKEWNNIKETGDYKYYFKDMGILNYIKESIPTLRESDFQGVRAENFVYLYLTNNVTSLGFKKGTFKDIQPHTFHSKQLNQEIDFIMHTQSGARVAIEVKNSRGDTKSATDALAKNNVNILLKIQNTFGGTEYNKITVPIFAIDKSHKYLK